MEEQTYNNPLAAPEHKEVTEPQKVNFLQDDNWIDVSVDEDFLDFTESYRPPRYTLRRGDTCFANVGDLHIISGKPGNGKTGLMSMMMAAILSGKYGNLEYALEKERPEPIVLYIDTEQGKDDTIALKNRVCTMAGIDYTKENKNFRVLRLRDTEKESDRWRKILKAIYLVHPTDIFLDGILDLVRDYNDQVECQPIIRKSMMMATYYDASIWMVLHENPLVSKLVGTLGSIAQRKVSEIFSVNKNKQCDLKLSERDMSMPPIYFCVDQLKARGKDIDRWHFQFMTNAGGWGIPVEIENTEVVSDEQEEQDDPEPHEQSQEELKHAISCIGIDQNVSFTALRERIKKALNIGSEKATAIIHAATNAELLTVNDNHYTANPVDMFKDYSGEVPF